MWSPLCSFVPWSLLTGGRGQHHAVDIAFHVANRLFLIQPWFFFFLCPPHRRHFVYNFRPLFSQRAKTSPAPTQFFPFHSSTNLSDARCPHGICVIINEPFSFCLFDHLIRRGFSLMGHPVPPVFLFPQASDDAL